MLAADFLEVNYDQVIWKTNNSKEKFSWIHIFFENNSPPPLVKYPFPSLLGMLALDFSLWKVLTCYLFCWLQKTGWSINADFFSCPRCTEINQTWHLCFTFSSLSQAHNRLYIYFLESGFEYIQCSRFL